MLGLWVVVCDSALYSIGTEEVIGPGSPLSTCLPGGGWSVPWVGPRRSHPQHGASCAGCILRKASAPKKSPARPLIPGVWNDPPDVIEENAILPLESHGHAPTDKRCEGIDLTRKGYDGTSGEEQTSRDAAGDVEGLPPMCGPMTSNWLEFRTVCREKRINIHASYLLSTRYVISGCS